MNKQKILIWLVFLVIVGVYFIYTSEIQQKNNKNIPIQPPTGTDYSNNPVKSMVIGGTILKVGDGFLDIAAFKFIEEGGITKVDSEELKVSFNKDTLFYKMVNEVEEPILDENVKRDSIKVGTEIMVYYKELTNPLIAEKITIRR